MLTQELYEMIFINDDSVQGSGLQLANLGRTTVGVLGFMYHHVGWFYCVEVASCSVEPFINVPTLCASLSFGNIMLTGLITGETFQLVHNLQVLVFVICNFIIS